MEPLPIDEPEIDLFLSQFENGSLPKARWTHGAHLFTGACYVYQYSETAALTRMRDKVSSYNVAAGGQNTASSGYHETVTVFWIKILAAFHAHSRPSTRGRFARAAVAHYQANRGILQVFYDFDVVASKAARRAWTPPNLHTFAEHTADLLILFP